MGWFRRILDRLCSSEYKCPVCGWEYRGTENDCKWMRYAHKNACPGERRDV